VKKKRGKPSVHALHQPPMELLKAECLPDWKRRKGRNVIFPRWSGCGQGVPLR